ncbi:MAG: hypothetical protein A2X39_04555 [Elusimicrobia bacterium GWC2_56_31]|nr:MAG: hypothetical protein A2X39_04555 [Elusimicrobia bacterium GWC2_56_31]
MGRGLILTAILPLSFVGPPLLYGAVKTSAASFLKLPVSADAIALGGNAVVLGKGIGSVTANPAMLSFINRQEFQTSYGPHLENYRFFNASYGRRDPFINTGLSFTRVAADDFEGRDAQGAPTGSFGAGDTAFNLSAARIFNDLSLGMTFKYISSTIENESASALAVDAGLVFLGDKYAAWPCDLGFSIRNLGTSMKYINKREPLPLTASAALAVTILGSVKAGINISDNLTENAFEFGLGMNFSPVNNFSLSGGLSRDPAKTAAYDSMPLRLNAGLEFQVSDFMLGYGFVPVGELGSFQRMSIGLRFGETGKPAKKDRGGTKRRSKPLNKKNWEFR